MDREEAKGKRETVVIRYGLEMSSERIPKLVCEETFKSETDILCSAQDVDAFCRRVLRLDRQCEEHLYLLSMNAKGRLQGLFEISHGSANMTVCDLKTVAVRMLLAGGISAIIVHNHPSGFSEPSLEDERMAERIGEAAGLLDIRLLDFLIIGNDYYSFSEHQKLYV